ncbi:MAG: N-acetylneuraminate synthase family protein [Chthoniobacterales bacterium]
MSGFFDNGCLLVAEVAQAHDGSLGAAHAFIDAAAGAGADAVKFQTHIAAAESTREEPWRVAFSAQDATRYDYWKRMEFSAEQWAGLKVHADERGILFLGSAFSFVAVDLLERIGVAAWKVASGEMFEEAFLDRLASTGRPVMLSTGMSAWADIDRAVQVMHARSADFALLQCTTEYPCPPENWGLNLLAEYRERYKCPVGLSDHSGTIHPGILAAWLGAAVVEVHLTLSRLAFGPDVPASLVPEELKQLADGIRAVEKARLNPVDKDASAAMQTENRMRFTKSVALVAPLPAGAVLRREDLTLKKPGGGIPSSKLDALVGAALAVDVGDDVLLRPEHFVAANF